MGGGDRLPVRADGEDVRRTDITWAALVARVAAADYTLTPEIVRGLLALLSATAAPQGAPQRDAPSEALLPVDAGGNPASLPVGVLGDVRRLVRAYPDGAGVWLRPATVTTDAGLAVETLLVARWLHHRIGLRHRTVQLILDHPTQPAMTFVQVRGLQKAEAPGAFDMPCAGHVVGLDTPAATLAKELSEELGLDVDDLVDLRPVGVYPYPAPGFVPDPCADFHNVEARTVYRARLKVGALDGVHFADHEVAALAVIARSVLPELVAWHPDRIASGLRGTLPWYTP